MARVAFVGLGYGSGMAGPLARKPGINSTSTTARLPARKPLSGEERSCMSRRRRRAKEQTQSSRWSPTMLLHGQSGWSEREYSLPILQRTDSPSSARRCPMIGSPIFSIRCKAHGLRYIDAPVTGLPDVAAAGALTLLVGADADDLHSARGIFGFLVSAHHSIRSHWRRHRLQNS